MAPGATSETTAPTAMRARPVLGIGMRHSYTAVTAARPHSPDALPLHSLAVPRPSCLTGHAGRALPRNPM
ncbi:hypothetical protein DB811_17940 [Xanthomonas perforans]|uniref:Uncharacterized protein n=1 Tax=Xanthomonas perforans TaxID=442694 RepID=A0AAQ0YVG9_XANPE|nr:hypothetical protein DB854_11265 [Xanthomonas perforans]RXD42207.1 hypothetical protein DB761_14975 [Xanthomonas perforans]RXD45111.1 hypothetical protein DB757_01780 [Xanthomonas perforans]RXD55448.1 hypothetical protein DB769_06685 [Xanthomonas perforans]RXD65578.1 hypothetical protein DB759_00035 [Xanthomonas perforans]